MTLQQAQNFYFLSQNEEKSRQIGLIYNAVQTALQKAIDTNAHVAIVNMPVGVDIELFKVTRQVYKKLGSMVRLDERLKGTKHYKATLTIWL